MANNQTQLKRQSNSEQQIGRVLERCTEFEGPTVSAVIQINQVIREGFGDHETRAWKGTAILTCNFKYMEHGWNSWRTKSNLWDEWLDDKKSREPAEQEKLAFACRSLPVVQTRCHEGSDDKGQCTMHMCFECWKRSWLSRSDQQLIHSKVYWTRRCGCEQSRNHLRVGEKLEVKNSVNRKRRGEDKKKHKQRKHWRQKKVSRLMGGMTFGM